MEARFKELSEALKKLNEILRKKQTKDSLQYEIRDITEAVFNSCIAAISMAYLKSKSDGFIFDTWCSQSNTFKKFLELYGEFCFHVHRLVMTDIDVDNDFLEILPELVDVWFLEKNKEK